MASKRTPAEGNEPQQDLGDRLRLARIRLGLDQGDVARGVNVSRQLVSKWERNVSIPDMNEGRALAQLLGVSYGWLGGVSPKSRWFAASSLLRRRTDHDAFFQALLTVAHQYGDAA